MGVAGTRSHPQPPSPGPSEDKSFSGQESTPRAPSRLMHLSGPDHPSGTLPFLLLCFPSSRCSRRGQGAIRELRHPQLSTSTPFLFCPRAQGRASSADDCHPAGAGLPMCSCLWGDPWAQSSSYLELLVGQVGRWCRTPQRPGQKCPQGEAEACCKGCWERIWGTSPFYL